MRNGLLKVENLKLSGYYVSYFSFRDFLLGLNGFVCVWCGIKSQAILCIATGRNLACFAETHTWR